MHLVSILRLTCNGGRQIFNHSRLCEPSKLYSRRFFSDHAKSANITHVIFDFDGVLLDTESIFYQTNKQCLQRFGVPYNKELKQGQMGRKLEEGVHWLLAQTGLDEKGVTAESYISLYNSILHNLFENPREMPGAKRLVDHLHKHEVNVAICTGSASGEYRLKTRKCQDLVEKIPLVVLAGDDPEVEHGKPSPDPYLVTMKRFDVRPPHPKNVLVFEDSVNGALSGIAAGCTTIMIPQDEFKPANWDEVCKKLKPDLAEILNSLSDFEPEKYGLPPFDQ
ncbi:haloacid dehalogenase-like hydrolase domain-containing protein [Ditylenchus destructor]|uniref:Haloacid dehalogenase-like hydrolase domain-containing protein n=1 Tax=Ditylenchus destructor TaxID=166010 RepID=A0AAD4R0D2_9BILA|nr:haloacid dehalogenase-like hydrolase domain-containing protein [Ditylenchus destructor]